MTRPNILVAGIGNIFLGDDAFGVEVVQQMLREPALDGVKIVDFGIRGLDLTYTLLDPYDAVILVDAVPRGETPGTLYVIEPDPSEVAGPAEEPMEPAEVLIDAHNMDPVKVLRLARRMGGKLRRVLIVGCEPAPFDPETEMDMAMSPRVRAAVPRAIETIHSLVEKLNWQTSGSNVKGADDHVQLIPVF